MCMDEHVCLGLLNVTGVIPVKVIVVFLTSYIFSISLTVMFVNIPITVSDSLIGFGCYMVIMFLLCS